MNEKNTIGRREVITGLGATFATMAISSAFAKQERAASGSAAPEDLQDPTTKYPKPPFPSQSQPWPGLVSKMDPVPDHGEKVIRAQAV